MLTEGTGYKMGGIYRHFDTKMDLAKAAFKYSYEVQIKANLQLDDSLNPKEKLLKIISNYKKMIIRPKIAGGCPLLNTALEVDDTNKEFRQLAKVFVEEVIGIIASILEDGKSTGLFKADIDSREEANYLFSTFEGAIMLGQLTRNGCVVLNIFDNAVKYLEMKVFS